MGKPQPIQCFFIWVATLDTHRAQQVQVLVQVLAVFQRLLEAKQGTLPSGYD